MGRSVAPLGEPPGTFVGLVSDIDRSLASLVRDVDLLCLDAGNTVVFLDHARLARACVEAGFDTTAEALVAAEGQAKLALDRGALLECAWSEAAVASAQGWGRVVGTIVRRAGLPLDRVPAMLDALWLQHRALNLWCLVPEGLPAALDRVRALGVRVAVVSNSEGMLEQLLARVGVLGSLDLVLDSGIVGVEKPDPRIFEIALHRFGVAPARALHLGDNFGTDVLGARAAGLRVALVDPHGHLEGHHADVPRVPGATEVARAIARVREG
jgi:FMN phosphatase YigB (HAD superfamily)